MCNELWNTFTPCFRPVEGEGQRVIPFKSCLAREGRQRGKGCWGLVLTWVNRCRGSEREEQSLRVPLTERKHAELHLCVHILPTDRSLSEEIPLNRNPDPSVFLRANESKPEQVSPQSKSVPQQTQGPASTPAMLLLPPVNPWQSSWNWSWKTVPLKQSQTLPEIWKKESGINYQ